MLVDHPHPLFLLARWSLWRALAIIIYTAVVFTIDSYHPLAVGVFATQVGILGTAVAFYIGFKNNQAYDRFWEARKAWGSIVNTSRTFAVAAIDHLRPSSTSEQPIAEVQRELVQRHIAWVHALRIALTRRGDYAIELEPFLSAADLEAAVAAPNVPTWILRRQSQRIEFLVDHGAIEGFARHFDLRSCIRDLYDHQGVCERIRNTPLVPHYTSLATLLVRGYQLILPFSLLHALDGEWSWAVLPAAAAISWVFDTMDRIGKQTEDPFSGKPTDVSTTAISRTIEIDLRAMLGDQHLPAPLKPVDGIVD
ncbi:MAG TPA: bestrophin family ion channel [Myxococcota bacterium]